MSTVEIYVNDHLTMVTAEKELIGRVANENNDQEHAHFLATYQHDAAKQHHELQKILANLDSQPSKTKQLAGWLVEKVGRLKLNGSLVGYTSLARVLESEVMLMAAVNRRAFWSTIKARPVMFATTADCAEALMHETDRQIEQLHDFHSQAVALLS